MNRTGFTVVAVFAALLAGATPHAAAQTYTTFDPPSSGSTAPDKVYPSGKVVGIFFPTSNNIVAGFIRDLKGAFTVVLYPGTGNSTVKVRIAGAGLAGEYRDSGNVYHGFIRSSSGVYTGFDAPGAVNTHVVDANAKGQVVGYYSMLPNDAGPLNGYVRDVNGNITTFTPQAGSMVYPVAINSAGGVVGQFHTTSYHGFIRAANGVITTFTDGPQTTHVTGWNTSGQIVGWSLPGGGYLRDTQGNFTNIQVISTRTYPQGINDAGQVVGYFLNSRSRKIGFFRRADGTIVQLNPPGGAGNITLTSISLGFITGSYGGTTSHGVLITGVH